MSADCSNCIRRTLETKRKDVILSHNPSMSRGPLIFTLATERYFACLCLATSRGMHQFAVLSGATRKVLTRKVLNIKNTA